MTKPSLPTMGKRGGGRHHHQQHRPSSTLMTRGGGGGNGNSSSKGGGGMARPLMGIGCLAVVALWFNSQMLPTVRRTAAYYDSGGVDLGSGSSYYYNNNNDAPKREATREQQLGIMDGVLPPVIDFVDEADSSRRSKKDGVPNFPLSSSRGGAGSDRHHPEEEDASNNHEPKLPKLVWLMSFPNSGTSYTMTNVQQMTRMAVATNYDQEVNLTRNNGTIRRLFDDDDGASRSTARSSGKSPGGEKMPGGSGPYLLDSRLPIPANYILTKTHCVGHCETCSPMMGVHDFEMGCRALGTGKSKVTPSRADSDEGYVVGKALHLFRNPFDNLVARMHLGIQRKQRKQQQKGMKKDNKMETPAGTSDDEFDDTPAGMKAWCDYTDVRFNGGSGEGSDGGSNSQKKTLDEILDDLGVDSKIYAGRKLPCYSDWFRWVYWHNQAVEVLDRMNVPVHVLYYENYTTNYNKTVNEVLDFLELDKDRPLYGSGGLDFISNKTYVDNVYDSYWIKRRATEFVQALASPKCWSLIQHYFEPYLPDEKHVALLISYPNSGTSYTMLNTIAMTNFSTATNHGQEVSQRIPIRKDNVKCPYVSRPGMAIPHLSLTKSHCTGFCFDCMPSNADPTIDFAKSCWTATYKDEQGKFQADVYGSSIVKKIVHLIRNPFDNIISRMHHALNHQNQLQYSDRLRAKLVNNADPKKGFREWCRHIDFKFVKNYIPESILNREDGERILNTPCHADFVRYVYWHNEAFNMQKQLGMPAFMLYYENYTANFDPTVQQLYRFLGHPTVGDPVPFQSGKSYMEAYFDPKHARDAAYLIRALATDETWSYLRHYFKGILVERVSPEESITNVTSPTVAWLLSYPDPSAGHTIENIALLSNTSAATNYVSEVKHDDALPVSARPDIIGSPYLLHPERKVPEVVLTKTHCSGYCDSCASINFVQPLNSFELGCRRNMIEEGLFDYYPTSVVSKAVHLWRNPFDNLVTRKDEGVQARLYSDPDTWADSLMINSTRESLRAWCKFIDGEFEKAEAVTGMSVLDDTTKRLFKGVPCASEVYRYVMWHDSAVKMMKRLKREVLHIYYEDYTSEPDKTSRDLANFLGYELVQDPNEHQKATYEGVFYSSDAATIAMFMRTLSSPDSWDYLRRYLKNKWIFPKEAPHRIAWLMSFPNSGTSYTMRNTVSMTNMTVAQNYAGEAKDGLTSLRPDISKGPFLLHPSMKVPPVVLTKTHCNPKESFEKFEKGCRTAGLSDGDDDLLVEYPPWLVEKVVHLIRSPFDNIVSRKHLGVKKHRSRGLDEAVLETFTDTRDGILAWCEFLDSKFGENPATWVPEDVRHLLERIPCYSDLIHYVKWHELATKVYEKYQVPAHILFYEDYSAKYQETVKNLYEFLDLTVVGKPMQFKPGKTYRHLFKEDEIEAMVEVIRATATPQCWDLLSRYFVVANTTVVNTAGQAEENGTASTPINTATIETS